MKSTRTSRFAWITAVAAALAAFTTIVWLLVTPAAPPGGKPLKIVSLKLVDISSWSADAGPGEIAAATTALVPDEITRTMFRETVPKSGWFRWKGGCLGTAQLDDGSTRQLAVSYYGGAFRFQEDRGYYEAVGESGRLFEATVKQIVEERFIPIRMQRLAQPSTRTAHGNEPGTRPGPWPTTMP